MNLKLSHQAALLIAVPLIFQLVFVVSLSYLLNAAETEAQQQARAKNLVAQMNELTKMCQDAAQSLFFYSQTKKTAEAEQPLLESMRQIPLKLAIVKTLAREGCEDAFPVRQLEQTVGESLWVMSHTLRQFKYGTDDNKPDMLLAIRGAQGIRSLLSKAHSTIDLVSRTRTDTRDSRRLSLYIQYLLVGGVLFNIVLAVCLAYFFWQGTNRRLLILMENSSRLAEEQTLIPALGGKDEIGRLDNVFHKMASSLKEAQRQERAMVRLKQEFVAMISHDLRTPLMSVQTDLCLLSAGASGELPGSATKRVTDSERNIEYVISLINNLLDVEKMEAGSLELNLSNVSLATIAQRAVDAVNALALNKNLTVAMQLEPIEIQADGDRLTQVAINLLSNAIKYSPTDGTVTIGVRDLGDYVELTVTDQGPGIPLVERDNIFNRFHQISADDALVHKGTGLGLAICKLLVEQHGGKIGVDSEEGKGCNFWCRLPKS